MELEDEPIADSADDEVSSEESGEGRGSEEEAVGLALHLPKRSTRGQRNRTLEGEEADAHEEFWGQQAWAENEEDQEEVKSDEFSSSAFEDSEDSDIDLDENDNGPDLMHEQDVGEGGRPKKRMFRPPLPAGAKPPRKPRIKIPLPPSNMTVRHSTATVGREIEAKHRQEAEEQTIRQQKRKQVRPTEETKPLTQRDLLEEAVRTEVDNKRSLEVMKLLMAEKKRLREKQETQRKGARIITRSFIGPEKEEKTVVIFTDPAFFPKAKRLPDGVAV